MLNEDAEKDAAYPLAGRLTIELDAEDAAWLRRHLSNFSGQYAIRVYDEVRRAERDASRNAPSDPAHSDASEPVAPDTVWPDST